MAEYTVAQVNTYIKNMFRQDFVLNRVSVKGEVSNCKYHTSGHVYFTLKDSTGTLACVLFAGNARSVGFRLENGMQVVADGRVDVYERDGRYQLYVTSVRQDGLGSLYIRYEKLKTELEEMGMFAREYKKPVPRYASRVGIVTASTGAAIQDIINISSRRNPYVQLILYPAQVQGDGAAATIVSGIRALDSLGVDVIIVGRGGGSIEDLWAFNEESVARAIFDCGTPLISAVGHETDFTIADFVADLRAPTPSAAAELAVADIRELDAALLGYERQLSDRLSGRVEALRSRLGNLKLRLDYQSPRARVDARRQQALDYEDRLSRVMGEVLLGYRHRLALYGERLNGLSPLKAMAAGYSYVETAGHPVHGVGDVQVGEAIRVTLRDGSLTATVTEKGDGERYG
jgi:exodeoxyribonuclease VII large subunit